LSHGYRGRVGRELESVEASGGCGEPPFIPSRHSLSPIVDEKYFLDTKLDEDDFKPEW